MSAALPRLIVSIPKASADGKYYGRYPNGDAIQTTPAWFLAMPDQTWAAIAQGASNGSTYQQGARLSDVAPNPAPPGNTGQTAIVNAWTSAAVNQGRRTIYLPAQGGHADYWGNEVYALDLSTAQPAWQRIWGPTPNAQISTTDLGYNHLSMAYADGSPRPLHGWQNVFCSADGRVWITMSNANPSGEWSTVCYSIDPSNTAAGWMFHGRLYPSIPGGSPGSSFSWQDGAGAWDPVTDTIWKAADFATGNGTVSIDCATTVAAGQQNQSTGPQTPGSTVYSTYMPSPPDWTGWSAVLKDFTRRCWLVGRATAGQLEIMDVVNSPGVWHGITTSGTGRWNNSDGAVYHPASKAVLVYGTALGASMMKLAITGTDPLTASYAWSTIAPNASNTITPVPGQPSNFNGVFSKFNLIEDMGNGQSALIVVCDPAGPTYVYKLPVGGV